MLYVFRHGHVADHRGDIALLPEGRRVAFETGQRVAADLVGLETVTVLYSDSSRTRETAVELARGARQDLAARDQAVRVLSPRAEPAIRNFQFLIDGREYWPTDAPHPSLPAGAENLSFLRGFWQELEDPIGYWLNHPSVNAEAPRSVAARLRAYFLSLLQDSSPSGYFLVTHSGPMRAFLCEALGYDPGEPDYCEFFTLDAHGMHYRDRHVSAF